MGGFLLHRWKVKHRIGGLENCIADMVSEIRVQHRIGGLEMQDNGFTNQENV